MDRKQADSARENYLAWKAEFEIFLFVGSGEAEQISEYPPDNVWTEYADLDSSFFLCKGFDDDMNRRLPVCGWYVGSKKWQGQNLEFANVMTAVTVECKSCDGTGEKSNGNTCAKCDGEGGTFIEFEESSS